MEAHRLAAWRDDFLEGGKQSLKGQRPDRSPEDRQLRDAERKVGQLTMENEILLPVAVVCRVLGAPRSTVYARRQSKLPTRPGPVTSISDPDLLQLIRRVLPTSPFAGDGSRKIRARLRR